jgi:hypothetical protein
MQVEVKFFKMWWDLQNDKMKDRVRSLVTNGQFEMVNSGWSMHDEACPTYTDMLTNMMLGHDFVLKEFGVKPRIGWQIDPFGHSAANARLFAEMGFDAWFFARLDSEDKDRRLNDKEMEFIWQPSEDLDLDSDTSIFTHVLYQHYSAPQGFNMYMTANDDLFIIDEASPEFNAPQRAQDMMDRIEERAAVYRTSEIFAVFGDDFKYINAHWMFTQLDSMIGYMNTHHGDKYHFRYSTPSEYIDAVRQHDVTWPTKKGDMFPYSSTDNGHDFWTGYFTSRANAKEYVRRTSSALSASSSLYAIKMLSEHSDEESKQAVLDATFSMMDAVGILQHHDAITGTAKQAVADNYDLIMAEANAINDVQYNMVIGEIVEGEMQLSGSWVQCERTNDTYEACPIASADEDLYVAVHNPSSIALKSVAIEVRYKEGVSYKLLGHSSKHNFDVEIPQRIIQKSDVTNKHDVESNHVLLADMEVPAFSVRVAKLVRSDEKVLTMPTQAGDKIESGSGITLEFNGFDTKDARLMFDYVDSNQGISETVEYSIRHWLSYVLDNGPGLNSGAYLFRPIRG